VILSILYGLIEPEPFHSASAAMTLHSSWTFLALFAPLSMNDSK
jgi:hypothetical protein